VPRRPRPRARPPAQQKKARHRYTAAPSASVSSEAGTAAASRVLPFAARSARVEARPAPPRAHTYDYGYVLRELRRIAMIGGVMLVLVVVFSFLLR